ncbi:MAG: hypothetical protein IJ894_04710, partial [Bacteroidales bacterium]|nr:hypothetical protein [Bacteroidales bacterium]
GKVVCKMVVSIVYSIFEFTSVAEIFSVTNIFFLTANVKKVFFPCKKYIPLYNYNYGQANFCAQLFERVIFFKKTSQKICSFKKSFIPLQPKILVTTQLIY